VIVRRIYWLGQQGYEGALSRCWERSCTQANEILEIGANIGFYTVLGSKAAGKSTPYTAVEPHPVTHRILRRNVDLNQLSNVKLIEAAVVGTKASETKKLMIPIGDPDQTPAGAFLEDARSDVIGKEGAAAVRLVEAPELIGKADLLKLDVEGCDFGSERWDPGCDFVDRGLAQLFGSTMM